MAIFRSATGNRNLLILLVSLTVVISCGMIIGHGCAWAAAPVADAGATNEKRDTGEYHTPLAGERKEVPFLGEWILIPGEDRSHMNAVTLGATLLHPRQGSLGGLPIGAVYFRHFWEDSRTRDVVSLFVNELEYAKEFGPLELVTHFENYNLPWDQNEVVNGQDDNWVSVTWGEAIGSIGPGLRIPVAPFQIDNDLRLQLLGRVGYFYADRSHETGPDVVIPPNTMLYGARLRARYDGMRRNMLELAHSGIGAGFDLDYMHREGWRNLSATASGAIEHDYYQATGFLVGAGGIPGLSERDRVLVSLNGGVTKHGDRYNAFQINGGPFPEESDDLVRPHYTGAIYDYVRATSYATATLAYRRELTFFMYLTLAGSYIWADRITVRDLDRLGFKNTSGAAGTASIDSAFLWDSALYLSYSWESNLIRNGKAGSAITLNWNKMF